MKVIIRLLLREPVIRRCLAGENKISIDSDGNIYPCDSFVGIDEFIIGNIENGYNKRKQNFNGLTIYERESCRKCWAKLLCGGDCYYNSYLANQDINSPDLSYCVLMKHLIERVCEFVDVLSEYDEMYNYVERYARLKVAQEW